MCYPWYMPKPKGLQLPLCTFYGNECITRKVSNTTHRMESCPCLPSCSEITYKYVIDSVRKFTTDEVASLCSNLRPHQMNVYAEEKDTFNITRMVNISKKLLDHAEEKCYDYVSKGYARVTVKMAGSSYLRRSQSIAMSFSDKLGVIGGTVGVFSGFSFIGLFELCYWVVITLIKFFKSSVEPEEKDPIEKLREEIKKEIEEMKKENKKFEEMNKEMKKENDALKTEVARHKEILMKIELLPPQEKLSETIVITDIE